MRGAVDERVGIKIFVLTQIFAVGEIICDVHVESPWPLW